MRPLPVLPSRPTAAFDCGLDGIQVASPCTASWDAMAGDDRVRFCGLCAKNVYDLSGMRRGEAEALVFGTEGKVCVRFFRRQDGTVLTDDCPVGLKAIRRAIFRRVAAAFVLVAGLLGAPGCDPRPRNGILRDSKIRQAQPFRALLEWIDPQRGQVMMGAPVPQAVMGRMVAPPTMGKPAPPPPQALMGEVSVPPAPDTDRP